MDYVLKSLLIIVILLPEIFGLSVRTSIEEALNYLDKRPYGNLYRPVILTMSRLRYTLTLL